ncbi:MAG TPA: PIG-L family deacetylase [Thermoflexia bacterium]|nr:PIG-L family deacetylase [Thermoflexia bacterium]
MKFNMESAEVFVPDGLPAREALARTTHLAVGAHQDDLEIMAIDGILACFQRTDRWFTGVVLTNGSGSPRDALYAGYTDAEMQLVRQQEQRKAAILGEYGAQVQLDYPSALIKDTLNEQPVEDLVKLLQIAQPEIIYTHNLADKHNTHVAATLRLIEAARRLPAASRPAKIYGCEVWRALDWLLEEDKVTFDCSAHEGLQMALVGVYDSQVAGGKRYDLATMGRRRANATYYASHTTDTATGMVYAMDLTPLLDPERDIQAYVTEFIARLSADVSARLAQFRLPR